jgi:hypothetical protein
MPETLERASTAEIVVEFYWRLAETAPLNQAVLVCNPAEGRLPVVAMKGDLPPPCGDCSNYEPMFFSLSDIVGMAALLVPELISPRQK